MEAANGGTLFRDEIRDIPVCVQTSLLRVLQEKEITRLGESKPRKIDVHILAEIQRNLTQEVAKGNFREDLLYRIRVARIQLPPLREHREDIPLLVGSFLGQFRVATGKLVQEVGYEAMGMLMGYSWPGNVRELKSAIEFAAIRCGRPVVKAQDLPPEILDTSDRHKSYCRSYQDEKERLLAALESSEGNRSVAARLLGVSRATFYRRLVDLNCSYDGLASFSSNKRSQQST